MNVRTLKVRRRGGQCSRAALGTRERRSAFTLVELLVVVGIIVLLIGILVPSLWYAEEHAYNTQCRHNLKEISHILLSYGGGKALRLPNPGGWIGAVGAKSAWGILKCPKHFGSAEPGKPGTTGGVQEIETPVSAGFDDLESPTVIHMFTEQMCFTLPSDVRVNITAPGYYDRNYSGSAATVPAGTTVDCYFLHYAPIGSQSSTSSGSVTFNSNILGIICLDAELDGSDPVFGLKETAYPTGQHSRGFESGAEQVELSDDYRTFTIHRFHSTFPGEQVRILTMPGGFASYGMNQKVSTTNPRLDQVLLVEYNKPVADSTEKDYWDRLAPRHFGKVNCVFVNGSVKGLAPEDLDPGKDIWQHNP